MTRDAPARPSRSAGVIGRLPSPVTSPFGAIVSPSDFALGAQRSLLLLGFDRRALDVRIDRGMHRHQHRRLTLAPRLQCGFVRTKRIGAEEQTREPFGRIVRLDLGADRDVGIRGLFVGEDFGLGLLRFRVKRKFEIHVRRAIRPRRPAFADVPEFEIGSGRQIAPRRRRGCGRGANSRSMPDGNSASAWRMRHSA